MNKNMSVSRSQQLQFFDARSSPGKSQQQFFDARSIQEEHENQKHKEGQIHTKTKPRSLLWYLVGLYEKVQKQNISGIDELWEGVFNSITMKTKLTEKETELFYKTFHLMLKSRTRNRYYIDQFMTNVKRSTLKRPRVTNHFLRQVFPVEYFPESIHKYSRFSRIGYIIDFIRYLLMKPPRAKFGTQVNRFFWGGNDKRKLEDFKIKTSKPDEHQKTTQRQQTIKKKQIRIQQQKEQQLLTSPEIIKKINKILFNPNSKTQQQLFNKLDIHQIKKLYRLLHRIEDSGIRQDMKLVLLPVIKNTLQQHIKQQISPLLEGGKGKQNQAHYQILVNVNQGIKKNMDVIENFQYVYDEIARLPSGDLKDRLFSLMRQLVVLNVYSRNQHPKDYISHTEKLMDEIFEKKKYPSSLALWATSLLGLGDDMTENDYIQVYFVLRTLPKDDPTRKLLFNKTQEIFMKKLTKAIETNHLDTYEATKLRTDVEWILSLLWDTMDSKKATIISHLLPMSFTILKVFKLFDWKVKIF